jgi:hypothetical protein
MKQAIDATFLCLLTGALGACAAGKVDIGNDKPAVALGASLSDYQGSWHGYAEAFQFGDGSDNVALSLDQSGAGSLSVGDSAPLPPPDITRGYPPTGESPEAIRDQTPALVSGFDYPVAGAKVQSRRIQLATSTRELYRAWCEMQAPMLAVGTYPTTYVCPGGGGYSFGGDPPVCMVPGPDPNDSSTYTTIDCGVAMTCLRCTCTETSCSVTTDPPDVQLDAALESDGQELVGTLVLDSTRITVRMMRD